MRKRGRHDEDALAREQPSRGEEIAEDRGLSGAALKLQELVGNTAATALLSRTELQRDAAPTKPAKPPPQEKPKERAGGTYTLTVSDVGTFQILSFSWISAQSGVGGAGSGGGGAHQPKGVVVSKYADEHSPKLIQHVSDGRPVAEVVLVVTADGQSVTFKLKNAHITNYQTGGSGGSDARPVETYSFESDSIEMEPSGAEGQSPGGGGGAWDTTPYPG